MTRRSTRITRTSQGSTWVRPGSAQSRSTKADYPLDPRQHGVGLIVEAIAAIHNGQASAIILGGWAGLLLGEYIPTAMGALSLSNRFMS
jgi:hypothetical protein